MGTSRCWQDNVVKGFSQNKNRRTVADRKKTKRLMVRKIVKELEVAGKKVDLQAINQHVVNIFRRKRVGHKPRHKV